MSACTKNKSYIDYKYYDTPEGCDIDKKVFVLSKYGAATGIILSTHDVLMYSHASGWVPILRRYAYHTLPLVLMGTTFAIVANNAVKLRQRNDPFNYFVGGFACGPILAYYLGSYHAVLLGGIALGVVGAIKKDAVDNKLTLFPNVPGHMRTVWQWRKDYTLVEDPKNMESTPPCKEPSGFSCVIV